MASWQHPSSETAAAFHDNHPSSDALTDFVEDTTPTAWFFSTTSGRSALKGSAQPPRHSKVGVRRHAHFLQLQSHHSERYLHDRLEHGERQTFFPHVSWLFLLFHTPRAAVTGGFTLPVGHTQEAFNGRLSQGTSTSDTSCQETKKALALPCPRLKRSCYSWGHCPQQLRRRHKATTARGSAHAEMHLSDKQVTETAAPVQ